MTHHPSAGATEMPRLEGLSHTTRHYTCPYARLHVLLIRYGAANPIRMRHYSTPYPAFPPQSRMVSFTRFRYRGRALGV